METPEQFAKSIQVTSKYTRTLLLTLGRIHALLGNQCNVSCKQKTPSQGPIRVSLLDRTSEWLWQNNVE